MYKLSNPVVEKMLKAFFEPLYFTLKLYLLTLKKDVLNIWSHFTRIILSGLPSRSSNKQEHQLLTLENFLLLEYINSDSCILYKLSNTVVKKILKAFF